MDAMLEVKGLYMGARSPAAASKENLTSSTVTGSPSCHVWPGRRVRLIVVSSSHS